MLSKELIEMMFKEDGEEEYHIPNDPITPELLEDGSFLKHAISICSRNRTEINLIKLSGILRDSWVWIPCNAVMSDADYKMLETVVVGQEFTMKDAVRLIPDILQNGDKYFFPVFTSAEEMGEYGEHFSKVQKHFLEAVNLAVNNEKNVSGIVINAFSDPFVVPREMFNTIAKLKSSIKGETENE
ncbi:MAG: SseB family protein [Erysipelotrichaceae bacterium]|nr:SseB family protein [Erysipelotrichaceae bacterium]